MALITLEGTYKDGQVQLAEQPTEMPAEARVLVTFLMPTDNPLGSEGARERVFARMREGIDLGGPPYPRREELYDRVNRW